jgi:hypothetical protein
VEVIRMKKGQAAMEFLMTYGWAILVVLAAIGALAYFGVLSPSKLLPSKCTLSPGINFGDCKASSTGLQVTLYDGLGVDIKEVNVTVVSKVGSSVTCNETQPAAGNIALLGNGATSPSMTFCAVAFATAKVGERFDADVSVSYVKEGEALSHLNSGAIQIKVEQ